MALITPAVTVGPANVSKAEIIVANSGNVTFGTGNVYRMTLEGTFGTPEYAFNLRYGANGNVTDPVIYSSSNESSNAYLLTDLRNWGNSNPGASPTAYYGPAPAGPANPGVVSGELLVVVALNDASNATVSLIGLSPSDGGLMSALGGGVISTSNVAAVANGRVTVGVQAFSANAAVWVGLGNSANAIYGATPMGNSWNLVAGTAVANGKFQLGAIEQLA